jgi:hypothetical protein
MRDKRLGNNLRRQLTDLLRPARPEKGHAQSGSAMIAFTRIMSSSFFGVHAGSVDSFGARSRKETTKATTPRGQRTRFGMTPYRRGAIACDTLSCSSFHPLMGSMPIDAEGVAGPFPHFACVPLTP